MDGVVEYSVTKVDSEGMTTNCEERAGCKVTE